MQFVKPRIYPIIIILLVICLAVSTVYQHYRIAHLRRIVDHLSSVNPSFSKWMNGGDAYKFVEFINKAGYYPIKVEGRRNNKINEFRFVIKNHPKGPWWWYWYYGVTPERYERFKQKHLREGCEEIYHQSFDGVDGFETHQCVFLKLTATKSTRATAAPATNAAAEGPPRIVATAPAAGAADVDPATSEIVVTFDCEMAHGFSWTGGGPDYPPKAEGQAPHWRDTRMAVLPVKLEPGHYYRVGINSESYRNFRSGAGVPALPSMIYFTTRGADSNMTAKIRKPTILEIQPANGADAVDPKTTELRVTFTVPMGGGYSWTGSGSDYPSMPEGERPHWTNDHRTCVLPVRLEPNHQYRIGLNSSSHQNFQSAAGVPLDPVIYTFRTGQ